MIADLSQLALGLYEALHDGTGLMPALAPLADRLGASSYAAHLIRYENGRPVGSISRGQGGVAGAPLEEYARYWVRHDPWAKAVALLPAGVHDISDYVTHEALRQSQIWNEWGRRNDAAFHMLGAPLLRNGDSLAGIYFHRRENEPPFTAGSAALLEALFPHLRRIFAAAELLAPALGGRGMAMQAGLEALTEGVALLNGERRLVFANAALRRMAAERDGLALAPVDGITAAEPAARLALSRAVTAALAAASGRIALLPTAGSLALPRLSERAPWLIRALPLRRSEANGLPADFRGAMLLVTDGEIHPAPAPALLARLFGLTGAQAALAAALAAGRSLDEHARRRGISRETARSHLAEIRRKTGCRRQAELALLLSRLPGQG
jgi:DNA-binding CsgD family transcriptional regulator